MDRVFCGLPFTHSCVFLNGKLRPCCIGSAVGDVEADASLREVINHQGMVELRKQMIKGEVPVPCKSCYKNNKDGSYSHRMFEHHKLAGLYDYERPKRSNAKAQLDYSDLTSVEIRLDNTCPKACAGCGSIDSSTWRTKLKNSDPEEQFFGDHDGKFDRASSRWIVDQFMADAEKLSKLKHVRIVGGEPLASKLHIPFLRRLVELGLSQQISLEYITSASVSPTQCIELWQDFRSLKFLISYDGPSKTNSYIRYPCAEGEVFKFAEELFQSMQRKIAEVEFECTVQALNVLYLRELLEEVADWRLSRKNALKSIGLVPTVGFHLLRSPPSLAVSALPDWYLETAIEKLEAIESQGLADVMTPGRRNIQDIIDFVKDSRVSSSGVEITKHLDWLDRTRGASRFELIGNDPFLVAR